MISDYCALYWYASSHVPDLEGNPAGDAVSVWDDALGDVLGHGGLDHLGEDSVPVQSILGQVEVVNVAVEGVFLVQGEEPVFQDAFHCRFPCLDQEGVALGGGHAGGFRRRQWRGMRVSRRA